MVARTRHALARFAPDMVAVGTKIRLIRDAKGLTLQQLEKECDVPASTISRCERARTNASLTIISRIADGLEIPVGYLLGEIAEFEALKPDSVAARTSLEKFLNGHLEFTEQSRATFRAAADREGAPRTSAAWAILSDLARSLHKDLP